MPKKRAKHEKANLEDVIDSFEGWLERQSPKHAKARHGFVADAKIEESP